MYLQYPNCNAIWGMEEIDEQCCYACGYPDPDEDDLEFDDNDLYEQENYT